MSLDRYAEAFERLVPGWSGEDAAVRRRQLGRFLDQGFPDRSSERWHYTDLSAFNDRRFDPVSGPSANSSIPQLEGTTRLAFVDGMVDTAHTTAALTSTETMTTDAPNLDATEALNAAFASPGLSLRLAAGEILPQPLHVVVFGRGGGQPSMSHQRHRIVLGEHAAATVIFELCGEADGERLLTQHLDIELAAGARLNLIRIQRETAGSTLLGRTAVQLGRDAAFDAVLVDAGTGLARHDFEITLTAAGADARLHALCMPRGKAHADTLARLVHAAPRGRSRLWFRGIVDDRAKAIFNGRVIVQPGAQKTDSEQRIASLLLSPRAEINAKPDLEIHADDVKCAHGATVGQLDEAALGYLRSRGIAADAARALLLRAFALDAIEPVRFAPLRRHLEALLGFPAPDEAFADAA